ncbi:uncharacterized protein LOC129575706 [Sitodiplosis mosellana]|uniref:uncharacterized protein LOC129575706 n=1 Tax=Sitodiplosis mosellana TaxID=263140 RepID=UPI0024452788|nr:uncharacterized protein LOC129575706 [Sitodiplosis mosellana]
MNTKHCVYRNCGNSSAFSPKITFFGFPLKDVEKCQHWVRMAGCGDINLKNRYLCEEHFSTIYISKTPRRTVLLPNALPYRYDENINKNENENYEEEYNSEKNTSRDDILLDPINDENDIIYSETIEMMRQNEDGTEENVETLEEPLIEEEMQNINSKVKMDPHKMVKFVKKTYDSPIGARVKKVEQITSDRVSLVSSEFVNHVTKRQKLHTSADNIIVSNQTVDTEKMEKSAMDEEEKSIDKLDNTVDNPDITTFIYKGEEYIQMPKRIYLQQRAKLDADVNQFRKYRSILQDIKSLVNSTD